MYLVLTALLALNVSAEVLQAFQNLADSLQITAEQFNKNNAELAQSIKEAVRKELEQGNKKNEILLTEVDRVRAKVDSVITVLREYADTLFSERIAGCMGEGCEQKEIKAPKQGSEGDKGGGGSVIMAKRLKRLDERENNYQFWMGKNDHAHGGRGEGKAYEMHKMLDSFISWANRFYAFHSGGRLPNNNKGFDTLVVDPAGNPFVIEPESKDKTWEYFTFHMTPAVANLAIIYKYMNDVYVIENELLELLRRKLSQVTFKIDSLILIDAPRSEIVVAGMKFETRAFVVASSSEAKPIYSGSGQMKLEGGGHTAIFSIPASAAVIPPGQRKGKQSYTITARVPKADGTFQEFRLNKTFEVVKPEIVVTSAAVQILYAECGNDLNIDVPALGELYDPRVTSDNAQVLPSKKSKKTFRVIPRGGSKKCVLNVRTNTAGQLVDLGTLEYKVIPPPRPYIRVYVNGQLYNGTSPIPRSAKVEIKVVPDGDFATALPHEANYQILNPELKLVKGLAGARSIGTLPSSRTATSPVITIDLSEYGRTIQPGNVLYVQLGEVIRKNSVGRNIKEDFSLTELIIPLNIGQ